MKEAYDHHRVTPEGRALGEQMAAEAKRERKAAKLRGLAAKGAIGMIV